MKKISSNAVLETVRSLRRNQTAAEKIFWELVRNRRLFGKKFLRQHPIVFPFENQERFFAVDFYCAEKKLIVEIDGGVHEQQKDYDNFRTHIVNQLGYHVVRFKNEEMSDLKKVIEKLKQILC